MREQAGKHVALGPQSSHTAVLHHSRNPFQRACATSITLTAVILTHAVASTSAALLTQVTKNIGVLQPEGSSLSSSSSSSGGAAAAGSSSSSRPHSKAAAAAAAGSSQGWWLPSWVVFTAVSVVMGGLACFMAVRLYARVRERQVRCGLH
jgi:hypothetical protein